MTSSGLSKTDFVRKTCFVFGGENITGSSLRKVPHFAMCGIFSPLLGINIFTCCLDSTRCDLSNKIGFTSIGVHMQKLSRFSYACFRNSERVGKFQVDSELVGIHPEW